MVWEVRPTNGLDTSGGAFKAGATGTDYSQQNAPQYSLTGLTTAAANAIILTASAAADMVGNGINITSGTNFTVGIYEVVSAVVGVSITVDRNCTTAAGAAGVAQVGGALQTLTKLAANMVGSNKAFVKAEATITSTVVFTFPQSVTPSETVPYSKLLGYTTTRGDNGQVAITFSTNANLRLNISGTGWIIDGFNINCASLTNSRGILFNSLNPALSVVRNCKVSNFTTSGIDGAILTSTGIYIHHCEITGGTSAATAGIYVTSATKVENSNIHDNACSGIVNIGVSGGVSGNTITNNTGSSSDGVQASSGIDVSRNVIYKNGRHGVLIAAGSTNLYGLFVRNNIITDHTAVGAAGLKAATAALPAQTEWDGNFYYNNTSNRVNMDDTATNAVDGVSPYTNVFDVQLTASPYTNAAGNDFTLNNTAGGGASVRGHGLPGVGGTVYSGIPGLTTSTGYLDGGVFQSQVVVGGEGGNSCVGPQAWW